MSKQFFYSHGKLLITGEYLVLDGVAALAIPTKLGQHLTVEENDTNQLVWKSLDEQDNCWFETSFNSTDEKTFLLTKEKEENPVLATLIDILNAAKELNSDFLSKGKGYTIETKLEFNRHWGLGSSSTLLSNIAQWAMVDPFELLEKSFGGSGYDIACAQHDIPIIYKRINSKPVIKEITFDPPYKTDLFFVYLNQKQSSKESIKHYQSLPLKDFDKAAASIKEITNSILECTTIEVFEDLITRHEQIISDIIKTTTVKSRLFPDYHKAIKSLGGWGGDFILVTGTASEMDYFRLKGYLTIIPYDEMIF
ncbi:GYDIA family GHMP kinase [Aquimarina addita]|uniref:GYDIA family GHMP kinase n=1 Tax=Aquimarina addita TaxID=870485 RepID=A0ABP6UL45_9FLAO